MPGSYASYERAIVAALLLAQIQVCVGNPGRVRAFARAAGWLAKTDPLDAKLLRRFGLQIKPRLHRALDEAAATLRELLDYRRQISDQLVATGNRCELAGRILRERLETLRVFLATELEQTDALIKTHIHEDDSLRTKAARLRELQDAGPVLASVPELGKIESGQLAALIGVAPFAHDSGRRHRCRHVRGGRHSVRQVLYMAAVSAIRCNPVMRAFYRRLVEAGKLKKIALIAVMRQMLHALNLLAANPNFVLVR
ncbi:MAG: transposase [Candidatus Synoicihabitans palmerolidicus]|nr:transposase [Candidatus Synoicihabitans palmerolidicus]